MNEEQPSKSNADIASLDYHSEDFTKNNGATQYVPFSHKYNFRPKRDQSYNSSYFYGKQGDIIILDTKIIPLSISATQRTRNYSGLVM